MALSRLARSCNELGNLSRVSFSANVSFNKRTHITAAENYSHNTDLYCSYRQKKFNSGLENCYYAQKSLHGSAQTLQTILKLDKKFVNCNSILSARFHTSAVEYQENACPKPEEQPQVTKKQALKQAVVRYGPLLIIFHISHSLVVLGIFYILVKSGVDMFPFAQKLATDNIDQLQRVLYTSSTFVVAYTLYKLTAPIRIGVTLLGFPYVLKVLRHFGYQRGLPPRPTKP